jgi:type IV secretory pathway component VirB8
MKISKRRDKTIMFNLCVHSEQSSDDVAHAYVRVREGFNSEEAAEEVALQATASSKGWVR